jgi:hypothetical protein
MLKIFLFSSLATLCGVACSSSSYADGPSSPSAAVAGDFRYEKAITSSTKLDVRDVNGPIRIEPASGDTLEVVAIKSGRAVDVARVQIVAREDGESIVVCAVWPGQDPSTCRAGAPVAGKADDDVRARVELRIRVPAKIGVVSAHTLNGDVTARAPGADVDLHTLNGSIEVSAGGVISADTSNGRVVARAAAGKSVKLATKNGAVEVSLPRSAGADLDASTLNGRVKSDFGEVPPPAIARIHTVKARVGAGGVPVSLRTMNGDVLVRASAP